MEVWWGVRALVVLGILAIGILISPTPSDAPTGHSPLKVDILRVVHLLSFGTAWGVSIWNSFLGDFVVHRVQGEGWALVKMKVNPIYLKVQFLCSGICLDFFARLHNSKFSTASERQQVGALLFTMFFSLTNLLLFDPFARKLTRKKHRILMRDALEEDTVATIENWLAISGAISCLANLSAIAGLTVHAWYISSRMLL